MSNLQECRASASPLGRDPAQALSECARTNMLFPRGSRPTAKEHSSVPSMCCQRQPLKCSSLCPGDPGTCWSLPDSQPGIWTPPLSLSILDIQYSNIVFSLDHPLGLGVGIQECQTGDKIFGSQFWLALRCCVTLGKSFHLGVLIS